MYLITKWIDLLINEVEYTVVDEVDAFITYLRNQ